MRRACVLVIAAVVTSCGGTTPASWPTPLVAGGDPQAIGQALQQRVPPMMQQAGVTGLSIALIAKNDVAYTGGFGFANVVTQQPMAADTVVEAASLGQPVLATVALMLVQQGALALDDPIAQKYSDPNLAKDPLYSRITLRQLLDHSSGLTNMRANEQARVHFVPGDHFSYSGLGYWTAQRLIEHVTKEAIDATADRLIFKPAGMTQSSFVWQSRFEEHAAIGHNDKGQPMQKRRPTVAFAPASFHTTADDYAKFLSALLKGSLVKPPLLAEMWKAQIAVTPGCLECPGPVSASARSTEMFWGLGWGVNRTADGPAMWLWGDNDVFRSYVTVWPEKGCALVYFSNSANGLSLRDDVIGHAGGGAHPDWSFVKYDQYDSPETMASRAIQTAFSRNAAAGESEFRKQKAAAHAKIDATMLDRIAFRFFSTSHPEVAVAVWELQAREFPPTDAVFDRLGLAYSVLGDHDQSKANYRRALAINPNDETAKRALAKPR